MESFTHGKKGFLPSESNDLTNPAVSTGKNNKIEVKISPGQLTLSELKTVYENPIKIILDESVYARMEESFNFTETIISDKKRTYGINTGIGVLASKTIDVKDIQIFQKSIILSHAVGVGPPASDDLVRLIMVLKINSLGLGYSGISRELIEALITLVNEEIYPYIPVKGSVGASGDLSPLSHMASVLLGEGKAKYKGELLSAVNALDKAGLKPLTIGRREGVALINGTQASTAFCLVGLFKAEDMLATALVCGSLTVEAALASQRPFDDRIQKVKGHAAQIDVAKAYRHLFGSNSEASVSHKTCSKVQDPYSLRCQPQVMGACLDQIRHAAKILLTEANSSSDNPVLFPSENEIISAGNFHAEFVAFAADNLALALAEIGSISERRTSLLMDKHLSGLPEFLVYNSGVNTGFMTAQVTAAALVSENKGLAYPASVDSIPTSSNQEDHVSMAPIGAKRLWEMAENVKNILAIEWMSACQGLDFRGLKVSQQLEKARQILREKVTFLDKDRFMARDIEMTSELINNHVLSSLIPKGLLPSWN